MSTVGVAVGLGALYVSAALGARHAVPRLLYLGAGRVTDEGIVKDDAAILEARSSGGRRARALRLAVEGEGRGATVVAFHGHGETAAHVLSVGRLLTECGHPFVAMEYPGYGMSAGEGRPTQSKLVDDAGAILDLLAAEGLVAAQTLFWGHSLGTGVAMALSERAGALVLTAPFTSITALASRYAPWAPAGLLVQDRFDSLARAPGVSAQVVIVHGERDLLVPASMGRRLAEALPRGTFVGIPEAGHGDLLFVGGDRIVSEMKALAASLTPVG